MALINENFLKLQGQLPLQRHREAAVNSFKVTHPKDKVIRMGIGDVTQPLPPAVIEAMHRAVDEMGNKKDSFHGYGTGAGLSLSDRCRHKE
jgi:LL-diaminopimelate aminotransferase